MKQLCIISRKVFHPALTGLPFLPDENGRQAPRQDPFRPGRDPNPARPRDPRPGTQRAPFPIHPPAIHPPADRRCPCLRKRDEKSRYRQDESGKPGATAPVGPHDRHHPLEEYLVCGYEKNGTAISQLILGAESSNGAIRYSGHVPLGDHPLDALVIASHPKTGTHPFATAAFMSDNPATWLQPGLACIVACSEKTDEGLLMTPVYRGLKPDRPLKAKPAAGLRSAIQ